MNINEYLKTKTLSFTDETKLSDQLNWCSQNGVWTIEKSPFYDDEFICTSNNSVWVAYRYIETTQLFADIMDPLKLSLTARFAVCDYLASLCIYAQRMGVKDIETLAVLLKKATKKDEFQKLVALKDEFLNAATVAA